MKTNLVASVLALVLLISTTFTASANVNEKVSLTLKAPGVVMLKYVGSNKSFPKVVILDAKKSIVYTEVVTNKAGIAKLYNLTTLPEGEYFFKVVDNEITAIQSIVYKKETEVLKPLSVDILSSIEASKIKLTCKGVDSKDVTVTIESKYHGVLLEEKVDVKKDFSKTYDLSKIKEKNVVITVISGSRHVVKEVSLENGKLVAVK